jgi:predicted DNA-binding transcriptional regulator YafY
MLSDDEIVMVVLGLAAARRLGLDAGGDHPEGALEKIHRVLPATLRRRVEALEAAVAFTSSDTTGVPVDAEVLLARVRCDSAPAPPANLLHVVLG